jgi:exonuclease SbcC
MIPARLTLSNFLCYGENVPPLDFTGIHTACLSGDNGHGKTAILDAMTWALWGEARGRVEDDLVRIGQTEALVDFEFYAGPDRYRVIRKRRRTTPTRAGVSSLQLFAQDADGWGPMSGDSIRDTQRQITDILHVDYQLFIASAYIVQGHADEFVAKTPAERKATLGAIIGLDIYETLASLARADALEAGRRCDTLSANIGDIDIELARLPDLERQLVETRKQVANLESSVAAQQRVLDGFKNTAADRAHHERALSNASHQLSQAQGEQARASTAVRTHTARIAECQTLIAKAEAMDAGEVLKHEQQDLTTANDVLGHWQTEIADREQEVARLRAELARHPDIGPRIAQEQVKLNGLDAQRRTLHQTVGSIDGNIVRIADLAEQRHEKAAALDALLEMKAIFADLTTALGKNGVQALIIDAILPELEAEANSLLSRMTDGRMSLSITTQRQTQKGSVAETLDILTADELGTRAYETFSGGEAFRINLALRIAISRLLARRAGAPLPTLIIDEGFGTQDGAGRERLVEALNAIQDDFQCVLVITHVEELRDAFPTRIDVVKTPAGSTIAVAGQSGGA